LNVIDTKAALFKKAFNAQRDMLIMASKCKAPDASKMPSLLEPTSKAMGEVEKARGKERNLLAMVSNGVSSLGWVTIVGLLGISLLFSRQRQCHTSMS
jgi:hypothetical protein